MKQSINSRNDASRDSENPSAPQYAGTYGRELPTLAVNIEQAGKMLGIARSTAYKLKNRGDLPTFVFGGKTLVSVKMLEDMVAKLSSSSVMEAA